MTAPGSSEPKIDAAFVTVPIQRGSRGIGPDLPDGVGFLELASPAPDSEFALYEIGAEDLPRCTAATTVPESLSALLLRAERHPPAMALMRDAVIHRVLSPPSRGLFLWRVGRLLERYLQPEVLARQASARCVFDEVGYRTAGRDYWLVAYSPLDKRVSWVSADFIVYRDSVAGFDVNAEVLAGLPSTPPLYWPDDFNADGMPVE